MYTVFDVNIPPFYKDVIKAWDLLQEKKGKKLKAYIEMIYYGETLMLDTKAKCYIIRNG